MPTLSNCLTTSLLLIAISLPASAADNYFDVMNCTQTTFVMKNYHDGQDQVPDRVVDGSINGNNMSIPYTYDQQKWVLHFEDGRPVEDNNCNPTPFFNAATQSGMTIYEEGRCVIGPTNLLCKELTPEPLKPGK